MEIKTKNISGIAEIPKEQRLSMILSSDSLCAYYICLETGNLLWSENYPIPIENSSNKLETFCLAIYQKTKPARTYIFIDNTDFTLVPKELFSYGDEAIYLEHVVPPIPNVTYKADQTNFQDIVCVYRIGKDIISKLKSIFGDIYCFHLTTSLLQLISNQKDLTLLYMLDQHFYMSVISKQKLIIHNRFEFSKPDDILYQLQHAFEIKNIQPPILLAGDVTRNSILENRIKTFFPDAQVYSDNYIENQQLYAGRL